jgi:hypothetical protein
VSCRGRETETEKERVEEREWGEGERSGFKKSYPHECQTYACRNQCIVAPDRYRE